MKVSNATRIATVLAVLAVGAGACLADESNRAITTPPVPAATGSITQPNYSDSGGVVDSFLVGANTILTFPTTVCSGVGSLGVAGNKVTYSGAAVTYSSGWESVRVTSFTNNTTSATYTKPTPAKPAAYGPVSGAIKQLNYSDTGSINGFVFTPATGSAVFVDLEAPPNATLAPLLTVGTTVSVTGTSEAPVACAPAGALTQVDASSLTIGTTTFNFGHGGK
jgi:hypothetical protein